MQLERLRSIEGHPCLLESIVLPLPMFGALADSNTADWDDQPYLIAQTKKGGPGGPPSRSADATVTC